MKLSKISIFSLVLGYTFLYIPLILVILFSFNVDQNIFSWGGFSTKWYVALTQNESIIDGVLNSLKIAFISATSSTIIGTLAAVALVRVRTFPFKRTFENLSIVPFVLPDVITGLSLLLFFVGVHNLFGVDISTGMITISIAHTTIGMAYVIVVVKARLLELDESIDEAAMDLGAKPTQIFYYITLPMLLPACVSGWFLSFAISLDDVVIASFLSSPDSTTLPMVIFSTIRLGGITPQINALSTLMLLLTLIIIVIGAWISKRRIS